MIKWSGNHITLIAVFFVSAFTGVFTINALCDLEIIEYAPNLSHDHNTKSEQSITEHNDGHDHSHHSSNNQHESNSEDPCCDEVTSQLESSLFSKIIKHQIVDAKYFLISGISVSSEIFSLYKSNSIIYHEYDDPPPMDGFSIRVLIQSFLN